MNSIEALPFLLKQLRMPAIATCWQEHVTFAEKSHLSYGEFLAGLMDMEFTLREQKKLERAYKASKLPLAKTLSNFDFTITPSINRAHIQHLAEDKLWVNDAKNLIFLGPSGVGKTHLAAGIAYSLIAQGVRVLFSPTTHLIQNLQQAKKELKLKAALDKLAKFDLLILDDIGYVKKSEQETSVLFELIAHRYETGSMLITANQSFSDWENLFPDKVMAVAAIDRIVHHAVIIKIDEESYRVNYAKQHNHQGQ